MDESKRQALIRDLEELKAKHDVTDLLVAALVGGALVNVMSPSVERTMQAVQSTGLYRFGALVSEAIAEMSKVSAHSCPRAVVVVGLGMGEHDGVGYAGDASLPEIASALWAASEKMADVAYGSARSVSGTVS